MADLRLGSLNYVVIMGRAVREPELKYTPKGNPICSFSIAVNRRYQDKETQEWKDDTSFFNVRTFGKWAEMCNDRLKKGSSVLIEGRLNSRTWIDQNGNKQRRVEIVANRVQILDKLGSEPEPLPENDIDEENIPQDKIDDLPF
ncbi:MAG: single-stranded DNA-binding protein [candidate division WOR-3 bacterium]|nr:single-stranded DNA-binding protein [candidate division WOR-3 bacterium]